MAGAVIVTERGNLLGEDLNSSRRRAQRLALRVGAIGGEEIVMMRHRIGDVARLPEGLEIRPLDAVARGLLTHDLIEMAKPLHFGAAFGEVEGRTEMEWLRHLYEVVRQEAARPHRDGEATPFRCGLR